MAEGLPEDENYNLVREEEVKGMIKRGREEIGNILELSEMGFFNVGDRYSFDQIVQGSTPLDPEPGDLFAEEDWRSLSEDQKAKFLKGMGEALGVELIKVREEDVVERKFVEGAEATVLKTRYPGLQVYVMHYKDPDLGTRYDLVRSK